MARTIKVWLFLLALVALPFNSWAKDELLFRIAPTQWPTPLKEPLRFNAWVLNQSDHDIRIPTELQSFVIPHAFDELNKYEPKYPLAVRATLPKEVESVKLAPGAFYGCTIEHGTQIGPWCAYWFELYVPKSDADPKLWSGSVESNKQFLSGSWDEKRDPK